MGPSHRGLLGVIVATGCSVLLSDALKPRYLLVGDAASLINPLSGEGIANAVRSGRVAAEHLMDAFERDRFDVSFNKAYDEEIYRIEKARVGTFTGIAYDDYPLASENARGGRNER